MTRDSLKALMSNPAEDSIEGRLPGLDLRALSGWMDAALNIRSDEQLVGELRQRRFRMAGVEEA